MLRYDSCPQGQSISHGGSRRVSTTRLRIPECIRKRFKSKSDVSRREDLPILMLRLQHYWKGAWTVIVAGCAEAAFALYKSILPKRMRFPRRKRILLAIKDFVKLVPENEYY